MRLASPQHFLLQCVPLLHCQIVVTSVLGINSCSSPLEKMTTVPLAAG